MKPPLSPSFASVRERERIERERERESGAVKENMVLITRVSILQQEEDYRG